MCTQMLNNKNYAIMKKIKNYLGKDVKILKEFENSKYNVAFWVTENNNMTIHGTSYIHKILDNDAHHHMYLSYDLAEKQYNDIVILISK